MPKVSAVTPRPDWDEYGLLIAHAVASRADCTRRKVGAVIMGPDRRIHGTGYNGAPPGQPGCASAGACPRGRLTYDQCEASSAYSPGSAGACIARHAERNAYDFLFGDQDGDAKPSVVTPGECTVFITDEPCPDCRAYLTAGGIGRVVWETEDGTLAEFKPEENA